MIRTEEALQLDVCIQVAFKNNIWTTRSNPFKFVITMTDRYPLALQCFMIPMNKLNVLMQTIWHQFIPQQQVRTPISFGH